MTERRALLCAGAGLLVLVLGWLVWGRGGDGGGGLPLLGALAVASFLFAAAVNSSKSVRAAAYAAVAALAFLAAAVDPATGYDQRNVFCFLLGVVFAIAAAARAQQSGQRLQQEAGPRGERALAAVTWTTSLLMLAAALTFVAVVVVGLWLAGGGG